MKGKRIRNKARKKEREKEGRMTNLQEREVKEEQEILERTNRLLSFDTTRTA
jgi:hypothetical protein